MTTQVQHEIVKLLVQKPGRTIDNIASRVGESSETVESFLNVLANYGIIETLKNGQRLPNLGTDYLSGFYSAGIKSRHVSWPSDIVNIATMALDVEIYENWQHGRLVPGIRDLKERFLMYSRDGFVEINICPIEMSILCMALVKLSEQVPADLKLGRAYPLLIPGELYQ